jgi:hypothetical protein
MTKGYKIPVDTVKEISEYIDEGILPSAFVYSVLCNRLFEACTDTDEKNRSSISEVVNYLINEVPCRAWGSKRTVEDWVAHSQVHKKFE